jgi:spore coat polysaccharide biosynthesis protein SpsF (cytidylyltransferase family)
MERSPDQSRRKALSEYDYFSSHSLKSSEKVSIIMMKSLQKAEKEEKATAESEL